MDLKEQKKNNINCHPWELSRAVSLLKLLRNYPPNTKYADVGAGDQFFTRQIVQITDHPVWATDIGYKKSSTNKDIIQCNSLNSVPNGTFDCVLLLDVLEHVEDEEIFLISILEKLNKNGKLLITVPAFQFLFSSHDRFLKHHRRYNKKDIEKLLTKQGIIIEEIFYFYFSLYIFRCFEKYLGNKKDSKNEGIGTWKYFRTDIRTKVLVTILNFDFLVCKFLQKAGIFMPGLSLCVTCRKKSY